MIKFFRKIRQNLLSQGKTRKYIKYALGEILLVMIGILLALQVNNWNENQKALRSKDLYVQRMINDLKADTAMFLFHENTILNKADDGKYIMSIINDKRPIIDNKTFVIRLQNIGRVTVPRKANNTFLDLQSSGNLKLFEDDTVIDAIRSYYITDLDFWYTRYVERTTEGFLPIVTDVLPFRMAEDIINSEKKENLYTSPKLDYDKFDVAVSDADLTLILENINANPNFNYQLKNSTRAHLVNSKIVQSNRDHASALIRILERLQ